MSKGNVTRQLINTLTNISSPTEMEELLRAILTDGELDDIPKRLEIIKQLLAKKPQAQIAKELKVGIATVTRGSKVLNHTRFSFSNLWPN